MTDISKTYQPQSKLYAQVMEMLVTNADDLEWEKLLPHAVGCVSHRPLLPVLNESILLSAFDVVIAHLSMMSGFLGFLLDQTPNDLSKEDLLKVYKTYVRVAGAGGWLLYMPNALTLEAIYVALGELGDSYNPNVPWAEQELPLPSTDESKVTTLLDWVAEYLAVYNLFSRTGYQVNEVMSYADEVESGNGKARYQTLLLHSDGTARLERPGEVYPGGRFSDIEIELISHFLPLVARNLTGGEHVLRSVAYNDAIYVKAKALNPLAVQSLFTAAAEFLISPYRVTQGVKTFIVALPNMSRSFDAELLGKLSAIDSVEKGELMDILLKNVPKLPAPTVH